MKKRQNKDDEMRPKDNHTAMTAQHENRFDRPQVKC